MTCEGSLILSVTKCNIMFTGQRCRYGFKKCAMPSRVALRKTPILTEFRILQEILFSSILGSMEFPGTTAVNVVFMKVFSCSC